jgi:hypothetical protein
MFVLLAFAMNQSKGPNHLGIQTHGRAPRRGAFVPSLFLGALALLASGLVAPSARAEGNIIGFGPGFFWDNSERRNEAEPDTGGFESAQELESEGYVNLQLWYLREAAAGRLLWGGGVAWYDNYSVVPVGEDQDNEPEQYGNMFQVYAEGDWLVPLAGKFDLMLGARLGVLTLFQSRDLEREVDEQAFLGFSVYPKLPRMGLFIGPHVGALWSFTERVGLRADFGVQFASLQLYSGSAEYEGRSFERSATLSTTRKQVLLGLQVNF